MNTNFDERQGFEDLSKILNYMHNLGCEYYDAWQVAEEKLSAAEKNLAELEISHEREVDELKREHAESEQKLRGEIETLHNNFAAQEENFRGELQRYRDYNDKLIGQLEIRQRDLQSREDNLSDREQKLYEDERELANQRDELDRELEDFAAHREQLNSKLEAYDALQEKVSGSDEVQRKLREKIKELQILNEQQDATIQKLNAEKGKLSRERDEYQSRVRDLEGRRKNNETNFSNEEGDVI